MINKKEIRRIIKIRGAENIYQLASDTMGIYPAYARGVLNGYGLPCDDIGTAMNIMIQAFVKMTAKQRTENLFFTGPFVVHGVSK